MPLTREEIAARAAEELKDGMYVNLGIGIPTLVPNFIPKDVSITFQAENGLLGFGPHPYKGQEDPDLINAGKQPITMHPGGAFFDSSMSFGMIRGGKVNLTLLGAMQVSGHGDISNWMIPNRMVKGMGGAMDLVHGAQRVITLMDHVAKDGSHKIVGECTLPLTGKRVVNRIITDLSVIDITREGPVLKELAPDTTVDEVQDKTGVTLLLPENPSIIDTLSSTSK